MGVRGTTLLLASRKRVRSVPCWRPMLTPSSTRGIFLIGVPVDFAIACLLSSGCITIAQRPKGTGCRCGLNSRTISLGVLGYDALQIELLRVSPTDCSRRRVTSVGR